MVGQKAPFKLKGIWAIRAWLQLEHRTRELAPFDLGLDSKLRVHDICHGDRVAPRAIVMQQKTSRPVQFEITEPTRAAVSDWTLVLTELTPCGARRLLSFTGEPKTCAQLLLLGHTKLESTVRYLGIEVDDALEMAEETAV